MSHNADQKKTHFGYQEIPTDQKSAKVAEVFSSVANKYDLMNDLMSGGLHRIWKNFAVNICSVRQGQAVLDLAGGTGDLTQLLHPLVGSTGKIVLADINPEMLSRGRDRLIDRGIIQGVEFAEVDAQQLPFSDNTFDRVIIGFGLRNVTDKQRALEQMYRVLKPGGRAIILEFSAPSVTAIKPLYDLYSFRLLPWLGKVIVNDEASYRYLAESIRMHPDQQALKVMMEQAQFENCDYHNLMMGIVAVHRGYKY